jgi:hypothetical protein
MGRFSLADRWVAAVTARFDDGWVYSEGVGFAELTGYGLTAFVRYQR